MAKKLKPVTGILIDPTEGTLAAVKWDQDLDSIYKLLRCEMVEVHTILTMGDPVVIWCDEEFWQEKVKGESHAAVVLPHCGPIAGRILITGEYDGNGGVVDCPLAVADVKDMVKFVTTRGPT